MLTHLKKILKHKDNVDTAFELDMGMTSLGSANEVSTGPTCQFLFVCLSVCLSVCVSGLFFKASNWMIYWLLTVVLATYLSD